MTPEKWRLILIDSPRQWNNQLRKIENKQVFSLTDTVRCVVKKRFMNTFIRIKQSKKEKKHYTPQPT